MRLDEDDSFHATRVLRLGPGDPVELADGRGRVFAAVIAGDGRVRGALVEAVPGDELCAGRPAAGLTVAQAVPRGSKMDLVVEKLSEIGVERLTPVVTGNSLVREGQSRDNRLERWRRLARAAASQAKRPRVMEVEEPVALDAWLSRYRGAVLALVTEAAGQPLGEAVAALAGEGQAAGEIALLVGPEAGFTPAELERLGSAGARFASLGPLVLRTETAALAAAAIVMHRLGEMG